MTRDEALRIALKQLQDAEAQAKLIKSHIPEHNHRTLSKWDEDYAELCDAIATIEGMIRQRMFEI